MQGLPNVLCFTENPFHLHSAQEASNITMKNAKITISLQKGAVVCQLPSSIS